MSANATIVALLCVLALAAVVIRVTVGPISDLSGDQSLYAMAKTGPVAGPAAQPVEFATSDDAGQ